jgi:3-oxoacyl-[acyl-carrier-protein] synthase III
MLHILGMGHFHPSVKIDNQFLEALDVGTTAQWIEEKIGILTRASTLPLEYILETRNADPREAPSQASHSPVDMGVLAARLAMTRAGVTPDQIGLVLCNSCSPGNIVPTEGQSIALALGIHAKTHEVTTACPVFALHMEYLGRFKEDHLPEFILCVSTAALTQNVNYNDRSDGAIWGDGAAAWIVSGRHQRGLAVLDSYFAADPTRCHAVVVDRYGHFRQDGRAVRDFSVRQTVRLLKRLEASFDLDWEKDVFIGHQANRTMLEQITTNREIPPTNHWHNVASLGNQAGAGAPACLSQQWDSLRSGQRIAVAVVGAGLSWGSVLLEAR